MSYVDDLKAAYDTGREQGYEAGWKEGRAELIREVKAALFGENEDPKED